MPKSLRRYYKRWGKNDWRGLSLQVFFKNCVWLCRWVILWQCSTATKQWLEMPSPGWLKDGYVGRQVMTIMHEQMCQLHTETYFIEPTLGSSNQTELVTGTDQKQMRQQYHANQVGVKIIQRCSCPPGFSVQLKTLLTAKPTMSKRLLKCTKMFLANTNNYNPLIRVIWYFVNVCHCLSTYISNSQ